MALHQRTLVKLLLGVVSMKFSSLLLCLKVSTCFRLSGRIFFKHSSLNVVSSLTHENDSEFNIVHPGFAWTVGEVKVGCHPLVDVKEPTASM